MPHITARYSSRAIRDDVLEHYSTALIDDLILSRASTFDRDPDPDVGIRTVIITCESEDLEWLSYKPDFPDSIFHFTVYDGPASTFAFQVLEIMRRFAWNLRLIAANERVEARRPSSATLSDGGAGALLSEGAKRVLKIASTGQVSPDHLPSLDVDTRLYLVHQICRLIESSAEVEGADSPPVLFRAKDRVVPTGNSSVFWSPDEVNALTPDISVREQLRGLSTFLTPPEVAYDLALGAWRARRTDIPLRFGDPSMGPGILYAAMRQASNQTPLDSAVGIELDPVRAEATARKWRRSGLEVIEGDFLRENPPVDGWTILLANPPYVRHQEIRDSLKGVRSRIERSTGIGVDGRADLYIYFVLTAHDWLAPGAVAAWLLPAEFLATDYGAALRDYLSSRVALRQVHIYDPKSPVFDNARISSTVVIYEKAPPDDRQVIFSRGGTVTDPDEIHPVEVPYLATSARWTWPVITRDANRDERPLLQDYFIVKRGIATGANDLFVLDDQALHTYDVDRKWVRPVLPRSRYITSSVIDADDAGLPLVSPRLWLLDTSDSIEVVRRTSPKFADYMTYVDQAVSGRSQVRKRRSTFRQESRVAPDFVFIYMAKTELSGRERFKRNRSRAVVLNTYLGLSLRPALASAAERDPRLYDILFSALQDVPSSELLFQGRTYVSGLLKLEPKELGRVRLNISPGNRKILDPAIELL